MEWMMMPLRRYAEFSGRSRRKEYWMFFLFNILVGLVLGVVDFVLGLTDFGISDSATLALLIPSIAVAIRRLHDVDRSGWWYGVFLIAIIVFAAGLGSAFVLGGTASQSIFGQSGASAVLLGVGGLAFLIYAIVLLVFFCTEGTKGPNRFGSDPKDPNGNLGEVFS